MSAKKQGRRSAECAEQTKRQIIIIATELFSNLGYERVSLRHISEKAGVSHSLIRHHFGSKEKIWHEIVDALDDYMHAYITELIKQLPLTVTGSERIYLFMAQLQAFSLFNPKPVQLVTDAVRQGHHELIEYFIRAKTEHHSQTEMLFESYNKANPDKPLNLWEMKIHLFTFASGAVTMTPFLGETWPQCKGDRLSLLLKYWELYNNQIAVQLGISPDKRLAPERLCDLVLNINCPYNSFEPFEPSAV